MSTHKWATPESIATALSADINSLSNGAYSAASGAIDNETDRYLFIDLELVLASLTPTGTPAVEVYLLPSVDGAAFVDGGGATAPPAETLVARFSLSTSVGAKVRAAHSIPIPPLEFKLVVYNGAGVSLASSGNTLKYRRHNAETV